MESGKEESILSINQKSILMLFFVLVISFLVLFRNLFFQPTLLLKSFGELSINPEIAFKNNKPTFLEFYAEWCEVCKEMAPNVMALKDVYDENINFVFLNVDNPKWENYVRKFEVNGIPQINLFDKKGDLLSTFIGKHEEQNLRESIENLNIEVGLNEEIRNSDFSRIKDNKNYQVSPRSHG